MTSSSSEDRLLLAMVEAGDLRGLRRQLKKRRHNAAGGLQAMAAAAVAPALSAACRIGNLRVAELLLRKGGADPNLPAVNAFGVTPLMVAAREGHLKLVRLLLDHGADLARAATVVGKTALMLAAEMGHAEMVKLIIGSSGHDAGCLRGQRCSWQGWTALEYAEAAGYEDIVQILSPRSRLPPLGPALLKRIPLPRSQADAQLVSSWLPIGRGSFANVYKCGADDSQFVAMKILRPGFGRNCATNLQRELAGAKFLLELQHNHVVRYLSFSKQPDGGLWIKMEFIEGRTLAEMGQDRLGVGPVAEEKEIQRLIGQVVSALCYIHGRAPPVLHRDIKGSNVMVTSQNRLAKLIDFGLAIELPPTPPTYLGDSQVAPETSRSRYRRDSVVGTPGYMAPEVWQEQIYSDKSDVYALGCLLFEMLAGMPPHGHSDNVVRLSYAAVYCPMPPAPSADCRLREFYELCTASRAEMRPSAAALMQHPWLLGA